jgi:hypothetical protein
MRTRHFDSRARTPGSGTFTAESGGSRETPVSPAGQTPPDQDSEPPRTADDGRDSDAPGTAPPASHPASPGALH